MAKIPLGTAITKLNREPGLLLQGGCFTTGAQSGHVDSNSDTNLKQPQVFEKRGKTINQKSEDQGNLFGCL